MALFRFGNMLSVEEALSVSLSLNNSTTTKNRIMISIIILNYNGNRFLLNCLRSVLSTDFPDFEVILVDNGSTDRSIELARTVYGNDPRLFFIMNPQNLGFGEGNNVGVKSSRGRYIVFLNNDVEVDPSWLMELVNGIESDQTIGAAQSKLLLLDDKGLIDSAGDCVNTLGFSCSRGRGQTDVGQYDRIDDIFSARGAAMIVKRTVFEAVGGFDSLYFVQYEDIDLGWRIRLAGYRIVFVPKSIVFHAGRIATNKMKPSNVVFNECKGYILTMIKNYEAKNLIRFNPFLIIIGGLIPDIFQRKNVSSILARFMVLTWLLVNLPLVVSARRQVQRNIRRVPDSEIIKLMCATSYGQTFLSMVNHKSWCP